MESTDQQVNHFEIPESRMPELQQRINRLVKTATKLGIPAPALKEIGETFRLYRRSGSDWVQVELRGGETITDAAERYSPSRIIRFITMEVTGEAPKLAGWRFLAKLEHTDAGTMVQKMDQLTPVPERFRSAPPYCEHCELSRKRRDTYVVTNESETKQVGRSCLKDFTGHQSPQQIASACLYLEQFSSLGEFDDDSFGERGMRVDQRYSLRTILQLSAAVMREHSGGAYVSRARVEADYSGRTVSTASIVFGILMDSGSKIDVTDQDRELAAATMAWGKQVEADQDNDYLWNLSVIAGLEVVASKRVGLAASMISAYQRSIEQQIKFEYQKKAAAVSEYFGAIAKREVFTLTISGVSSFETRFGTTTLYRFLTAEGNVAVWFASSELSLKNDPDRAIGIGDTVEVKATVKAHEVYSDKNGRYPDVKQTILRNVTLLKLIQAEQAVAA